MLDFIQKLLKKRTMYCSLVQQLQKNYHTFQRCKT